MPAPKKKNPNAVELAKLAAQKRAKEHPGETPAPKRKKKPQIAMRTRRWL